ncbi:Cytochrome P450 [Mycena kentingensis (nom. inval.)]|nr:Cytochrome P450 [Mycena kentingensis (nom. inval.)]
MSQLLLTFVSYLHNDPCSKTGPSSVVQGFVPWPGLPTKSCKRHSNLYRFPQPGSRLILVQAGLAAIPSVRTPSIPVLGFFIGAYRYLRHGQEITQEGWSLYPDGAFKVPFGTRWLVLVSGKRMIADLRKAPDDVLSSLAGVNSLLFLEYTCGKETYHDPYHIPVVRTDITHNIAPCFPAMHDEVVGSFNELLPLRPGEWKSFPAMQTFLPLISRVSNRYFIGMKCRDPELIDLTTHFSENVIFDAAWLSLTPVFLRPIAARLFGHLESATRTAVKHLGPTLQRRIELDEKYGSDWPKERPNDLLTWVLDMNRGQPERRTIVRICRVFLILVFGSLHTSTQALLHALYHLATKPKYLEPLREEVASVVREEGWTKTAVDKMAKLDSFLKECARVSPGLAGVIFISREKNQAEDSLQSMAFAKRSKTSPSPTGRRFQLEHLSAFLSQSKHPRQGAFSFLNYPNAHEFDGFRFSRMRELDGDSTKHHFVTVGSEFMFFGIGRHACPGRFLAASQLKLIMAHLVLHYNMKMKDGVRVRPPDKWLGFMGAANSKAEIMFQRRE